MARTTSRKSPALAILALVLAVPMADAAAGDSWEARPDPPPGEPRSTATEVATGRVFPLSLTWSGGAGGNGIVTLRLYDPVTGALVYSAIFVAAEDISSVTWIECQTQFPQSEPGPNLEIVPLYSLTAAGVLSLGPGAPGGTGRYMTSFCHEANVPPEDDSLYGRRFIDLTGWFVAESQGIPSLYSLDVHVRGFVGA